MLASLAAAPDHMRATIVVPSPRNFGSSRIRRGASFALPMARLRVSA